ncbi:MAG: hypothetical protein ACE5EX_04825, partial [Phycisphaerae bacterium]
MTRPRSRKALLDEFERISRAFGKAARSWKLELVEALSRREPGGAPYVKRMHAIACFLRAFPDDGEVYVAAGSLLKSIAARVSSMGKRPRRLLDDTGIA